MIGIADDAHPQEVFFNVIAAARAELDVVNMGTGPLVADLAQLPEHPKPKALDGRRVHNATRRAWVRRHVERAAANPVGQSTQEGVQPEH